jgi:hypothetical protein
LNVPFENLSRADILKVISVKLRYVSALSFAPFILTVARYGKTTVSEFFSLTII